jgi:hypothetical protein
MDNNILKDAKDFLIKNSYRPRFFSNKKLDFRCLAILVDGDPLTEAQRIISRAGNEFGFSTSISVGSLVRSLIHFKIEGYGLDNMIYWPSIRWDEEIAVKNNSFVKYPRFKVGSNAN